MRYTIIGGINGVGKSTVYSMLNEPEKNALGKRINVDEIVSANGDWRDMKIQALAGKQAVETIKSYLAAGCDFHQETTLAGRSIIHTIKTAKANGFSVHLWYIFVDSVDIAKQRVLHRVANGGHGVPMEVIEKRSITSIENLKRIIPLCDEVRIYNNTTAFYPVAWIIDGQLKILDRNIPERILSSLQI